MQIVKGERAIRIGEFLVIGDLHIGYEKTLEEKGYRVPKQIKEFIKRIKEIKSDSKKLIILGDVKHSFRSIEEEEFFDLYNFFKETSKLFDKVIIIKGNHDGNIEKIAKKFDAEVKTEYIIGNYGLIHGHKYPSEEVMKRKYLIVAHMHPTYKVKDKNGKIHYYPCFLVGKLKKKELKKKYKKINVEKVMVLPAFNKLLSGYNHPLGPILKHLKVEERILLDLTII